MRGRGIVFTAPERAELEPVELDPADLKRGEALVRAHYSVISAGTEGSFYTNLMAQTPPIYRTRAVPRPGPQPGRQQSPAPPSPLAVAGGYPARTGYGHLGEVLAVGPGVESVEPGQVVLSFSRHASIVRCNAARFALPVPPEADGKRVVFTRMAGVAITALRASSASAGDTVAVIGLGLVGNFAAQLFQLAGCEVIAFDVAPRRLEIARASGLRHVYNPEEVDPVETARKWAGAKDERGGVRIAVEAIGQSRLVVQAVEMAGRHCEVVLLGSPRASHTADLTPMLARVHLLGIKLIGALEWTFPIPPDTERARHTIWDNYRQIVGWITDDRLIVDPLRTHLLPPDRCQEAYWGLTHQKDDYLGVVLDWTGETVKP